MSPTSDVNRRHLLVRTGAAVCACACVGFGSIAIAGPAEAYMCPPCGCAMDGRRFDKPGKCPACGMQLIQVSAVVGTGVAADPPLAATTLAVGSGSFQMPGGKGREDKRITVSYYRPESFGPTSPILLVLPGSGRNADDYRDVWIKTATAKGVLVAALSYPERDYDFTAYQMGGVIGNLVLNNPPLTPAGGLPDSLHMRDEDITFTVNPDRDAWIFPDFDRIFDHIVKATGSTRTGYDIFGHSAGGQILHRLVLFRPDSKAMRVVAGNGGIYTLPDLERPQVIGMGGVGMTEENLKRSFRCNLVVLLGEADNDPERGGQHLHTPQLDATGVDRLSRGRYFFNFSQRAATRLGTPFAWKLQLVPGVAHDYRGMSEAGAALLYGV